MKKLTTISSIFALMAVPAVAAPTHTSATFPQSGVMEEDYQYTGQANVTNLKVSSGTANTLAGYTDCPSGYPNSDAGATSTDECYKACTVADLPANSHAATASGKNYSGANVTDTCAIATCETGYTLGVPFPGLDNFVQNSKYAEWHSLNGTGDNNGDITENGVFSWSVSAARVYGHARCSVQNGVVNQTSGVVSDDLSTGVNCWCRLDKYEAPESAPQNMSSLWALVVVYDEPASCANNCAGACANTASSVPSLISAVDNSVRCDANVITINWDHADEEDITANDAGSVTYGGNINTPKKAQHINGKIFTGWTFVTPQQ